MSPQKWKQATIWVTSNELEEFGSGTFIEEFVSGGQKNYAFSVFSPSTGQCTTKCKVINVTLNYENSKVVNFTTLRDMILKDAVQMHVHNPKKFKRKHGGVAVSEPETKEYKVVFMKHRLMDNFDSLPYGHDEFILFINLFIYGMECNK